MTGVLEASAALAIAIGSAIYAVGGVNANNKRNEKAIEDLKEVVLKNQTDMKDLMLQYQEQMTDTIEKNMSDTKEMLEENKENAKNSLSVQIQHIRETLSLTINEIRDDIKRLENSQNENSKLREELAVLRQLVRSLHRRMDLEVPESIRSHDYED